MRKLFLLFIVTISIVLSYGQTITLDKIVNATCNNTTDGAINISTSGFTTPLTYKWTGPNNFNSTAKNISNLGIGSYNVTVKDGTNTKYGSYEVKFMDITLTPINETCQGANDARVNLLINSGGEAPYTYLWSDGQTGKNDTNITIGEMGYIEVYVTITDNKGCLQTGMNMVNQAQKLDITLEINKATCGNSDGEIIFVPPTQGGPFDVLWSTGSTKESVTNLSAGLYSIQVSDQSSGCSTTKNLFVENKNTMNITPTTINASSQQTNDGQISLSITGGSKTYTVLWDNQMIGLINPNLYAGSYSATITDIGTQCISTICENINGWSSFYVNTNYNTTHGPTICSGNNGFAEVSISGGTAPYTYLWNTGASGKSISNLIAGTYSCVVSDATGQTKTKNIFISDANGPTVQYGNVQSSACAANEGSISISVKDGTAPYLYLWSNGDKTEDIDNLNPGEYYLTVSDNSIPVCHTIYNTSVFSNAPSNQAICMVTVDSITDHNFVVWENAQATGVDHYNIYRQGCNGQYGYVGAVKATEISVFEDKTALPIIKSYSYKLSAVDACGNESEKSSAHKTIHLNVNLNETAGEGQLIWVDYEGFANPSFLIYAQNPDLTWKLIEDYANNFTNLVVPFTDQTIAYAVQVKKPGGCDAWNGNQNKASGGPYFQASSNIDDEGMVGGNTLYDATLTSLLVDGIKIKNFNPEQLQYNIELASDYSGIPAVTYIKNNLQSIAEQSDASDIPGFTTVKVTAQNSTTIKLYKINFTISLSIVNIEDNNIKLFPNPSSGKFAIKGEGIEKIHIYSANGQTILSLNDTKEINNIDLSENEKGIYLVKIISSKGVSNFRLVIK